MIYYNPVCKIVEKEKLSKSSNTSEIIQNISSQQDNKTAYVDHGTLYKFPINKYFSF